MVRNPIQQAVIVATAQATVGGRQRPLALVNVGGVPLLKRSILTLRREGVKRFVVVVGPDEAAVRAALASDRRLGELEIVWVRNPVCNGARPLDDGYSLLCARPHVQGDTFITRCDLAFDPAIIRRLLEEPLDGATLATAITGEPVARALQIQLANRAEIARIGPQLPDHEAVFTGLMTAGPGLFRILAEQHATGDRVDLPAALQTLASRGAARVADVGEAFWQPVHSDATRASAERLLLKALRKGVDGIIARHINRRFSLAVTRLLMNTPVLPNWVTGFSLLVSIAAGIVAGLATMHEPMWLAVGAILWQVASMLDGTDGELARLKFTESRVGEWLDTLTDDIGKFVFFIGLGFGVAGVTGESIWLHVTLVTVLMQIAVSVSVYRKLLRVGAGSHYALAWSDRRPAEGTAARFFRRIEFMARRDYYVFACMLMMITGLYMVAIACLVITTSIVFVHDIVRPRLPREEFVPRS